MTPLIRTSFLVHRLSSPISVCFSFFLFFLTCSSDARFLSSTAGAPEARRSFAPRLGDNWTESVVSLLEVGSLLFFFLRACFLVLFFFLEQATPPFLF